MPKAIVLLIVLVAGGMAAFFQSKKPADPIVSADTAPSVSTPSETVSAATVPVTPYKNGAYSTTERYSAPDGSQSMDVTLTITDGMITESSVVPGSKNGDSRAWQDMFIKNYKTKVVGKNLADLNVSKVSGASLTTRAFNNALNDIRTQASI